MTLLKKEYEITPFTLAVIPERIDDIRTGTRVLEEHNQYVLRYSPRKIMDNACKFFGSSLRGLKVMVVIKI
ncbi:competence protein ComK [Salinibacillus xinjiangensis]|uniref:Uncharacterized protein n=1 Tax=Salinibacillus xinjiangensis TaxID=1229268 RepID=A0A6G1X7T4_9BACI|nr:hypothetical protein [Salinibacillus xinjiangensis]